MNIKKLIIMKRISNVEKRAIICLYNNNFSINDIASIFNCTSRTIYNIIKQNNIQSNTVINNILSNSILANIINNIK